MAFVFKLRLFKLITICGLTLAVGPFAVAQPQEDILLDLVDVVANPNDTVVVLPLDLAEIVSEYYAEAVVPESVATDVLNYLTGVYSHHGYHETGNWGKQPSYINYKPYKGDLPSYELKDFKMPVEGRQTSSYGYRHSFRRFHHGIDIALNIGDTVRSSLPGIVTKTGYEYGGYGRYVVVTHDGGIETLYGHLAASLVAPGDKLDAGTPLGLGGITGNATGPHLHFETRYRGVPINPRTLLPVF